MGELTTRRKVDLQGEQLAAFEAMEALAAKDDRIAIDGELPRAQTRVGIYEGETLVGFFSPFEFKLQEQVYWRCSPLFLAKEYRGKGLMRKVLWAFFHDHSPGLAFIANDNKASLKMFIDLGFTRHSAIKAANGEQGYWYTNRLPEPEVPDLPDMRVGLKPNWLTW